MKEGCFLVLFHSLDLFIGFLLKLTYPEPRVSAESAENFPLATDALGLGIGQFFSPKIKREKENKGQGYLDTCSKNY